MWRLLLRLLAGPHAHPAVASIALPRVTALPQFGGDYRRRMLWGTYRPGLYLGGWHICDWQRDL